MADPTKVTVETNNEALRGPTAERSQRGGGGGGAGTSRKIIYVSKHPN